MVTRGSWTRRSFLHAAVGTVALGTKGLSGAVAAPYVLQKGSKLTFWGGLIFSDKANKLLEETINTWGAENGIKTEVVMINQNETVQKVSAAVASNTMPDALDLSLDLLLLLSRQGVFLPLDDVYDSIGKAQGGWFAPVASATDTSKVAGGRTGIPFGVSGNLLLRRTDLLKTAGFEKPPATWEELVQQAAAVNKPPVFGLGLALSNVGDGNVQIAVLQSYGGRIADDAGTKAAIKSDETRDYLRWVKDAWDKGLFPPGNTTWDGAGDNQAYLAGQAAFIANTGSVGIAAKAQDPELYEDDRLFVAAGGPKGVISPLQPQLRAVSEIEQEPGCGQGADRAPRPARVHECLLRRGDLRAGAAGPGQVRGVHAGPDPLGPARPRPEGHGAGLSGRLQHGLCRHVEQLHRAEDGPARRDRRLGLRPGHGRGAGADAGDLRQVQIGRGT